MDTAPGSGRKSSGGRGCDAGRASSSGPSIPSAPVPDLVAKIYTEIELWNKVFSHPLLAPEILNEYPLLEVVCGLASLRHGADDRDNPMEAVTRPPAGKETGNAENLKKSVVMEREEGVT